MDGVSRQRIIFAAPGDVEVREERLKAPRSHEVLVRTICSAVSPGTERLVYEGDFPEHLTVDASIEALRDETATYPLSYGYACVGIVEETGAEVSASWEGTRVFAFQPHVSHFVISPSLLVPLPSAIEEMDAVLIPQVETAVNLVMDGRPTIGEKVVVFGQGVVGLLTTALLSRYPLDILLTSEPSASRRRRSIEMGATESFDPGTSEPLYEYLNVTSEEATEAGEKYEGADLLYELSGSPSVLTDAIQCAGFRARIVVGSWYGTKEAPLDLGGRFHRSRVQIISSQVSTIAPAFRGRWTKDRRMKTVLGLLDELAPGDLISGRFTVDEASDVYRMLASDEEMLQPVFEYN